MIKTDLSGFVVTMHSGLCEQYVKSRRTRPRALWQQTPPEPVLILQVQDCSNSSASATELLQSCTNPSEYNTILHNIQEYNTILHNMQLRLGWDIRLTSYMSHQNKL